MKFNLRNFIQQQGNPRELLMNFVQQNNPNPMLNNLITMARNGKGEEVEKFAVNMCREQGIDFYKEFPQFIKSLGR